MQSSGIISVFLILFTSFFSYKGLSNKVFYNAYNFEVDKLLINKDYKRLLTSGFLHVSWTHLIFNMLSLYLFSSSIETYLGDLKFLLVYFTSLLGGNLLSLFIHRHHGDYSSVGASGAICGLIFASIALFPGMSIGFFFIPFSIPGWLFGLAFVLYSIYGIKSRKDNIGHDAHLGGAVIGMILAILLEPAALPDNYITILVIIVPASFFIYMIITRPHLLLIDNYFFKKHSNYYSIDHKYNAEKKARQQEIDTILEKIHRKGINSLTKKEKEILDEYSRTVQ